MTRATEKGAGNPVDGVMNRGCPLVECPGTYVLDAETDVSDH